jgi:hypothetical protein
VCGRGRRRAGETLPRDLEDLDRQSVVDVGELAVVDVGEAPP